jgi:outer membrane biogenesis lipoprotein LolB
MTFSPSVHQAEKIVKISTKAQLTVSQQGPKSANNAEKIVEKMLGLKTAVQN